MDNDRFVSPFQPLRGENDMFGPELTAAGRLYLNRFELSGSASVHASNRVLLVKDVKLERRVALRKGTVPAMMDNKLAAVLAETEGVCPVYEYLPEERLMVMAELPAQTLLEKWARQSERIGERMNDRAARLMVFRERIADVREVLCTLDRLHEAGIGVGDVHGENIMFRNGRPVIIDFQSINWLGSAYSGSTVPISRWFGHYPPVVGSCKFMARGAGFDYPRVSVSGDLQNAASMLDQGTLGLYMMCEERETQEYEAATHFEELLARAIDRGIGEYIIPFANAREMIEALDEVLAASGDEPLTDMLPGECLPMPVRAAMLRDCMVCDPTMEIDLPETEEWFDTDIFDGSSAEKDPDEADVPFNSEGPLIRTAAEWEEFLRRHGEKPAPDADDTDDD